MERFDSRALAAGEPSTSSKRPRLDEDPQASSTARGKVTEKMRLYKDNLCYNPE